MVAPGCTGLHRIASGLSGPFLVLIVIAATILTSEPGTAQPLPDRLREGLRSRIEAAGYPARLKVANATIRAAAALPQFYEGRAYEPAWIGGQSPWPRVNGLLQAIQGADREGLRPGDYHLDTIRSVLARLRERPEPETDLIDLLDLELLLTDAFLTYAAHLVSGRVNPVTLYPEWIAVRGERDLVTVLNRAVSSNRIEGTLLDLLPDHPGYYRLRDTLARHRAVVESGGWPQIVEGPKLQEGASGDRVLTLRRRLRASGDLAADSTPGAGEAFDVALGAAVRRFQSRHGLDADGVVGPATLAALNVSAAERARQIELNLERWRWLPERLGDRHVLVNIASFELEVMEGDSAVLGMRVVVGRPYRKTPVFSDTISYLVFNPYWHVPNNLAVQDLLPQIRNDPGYLARQGIRVLTSNGRSEIEPGSIDWSQVTPASFRYRLRQDPGPLNALGRVKFMFPNRFNVYLHDTPARDLFVRTERGFSSGCIRVERPLELAEYLLRGNPAWDAARVRQVLEKGQETTVRLPHPVAVHLLYWTAWSEPDGRIQFRSDLYERDRPLARALGTPPPSN